MLTASVTGQASGHVTVIDDNIRRVFSSLKEPVADQIDVVGYRLHCCARETTMGKARRQEDAVFALRLRLAWA